MNADPNSIARWQQGLFWEFQPKAKKVKATPPEPIWLRPGYLPNYEQALAFNPPTFVDGELWFSTHEPLVFDIEIYPNYFLIAFKSVLSGKCVCFEIDPSRGQTLWLEALQYIADHYLLIGFNSMDFDIPLLTLALHGCTLKQLHEAACLLINGARSYEILKLHKIKKKLVVNHIDLIEVCPLTGKLKTYAARIHSKQIQDLPFPPNIQLTPEQIIVLRWYCFNDLQCTEDIYKFLKRDIELREMLGTEYNLELRSRSDAQIAESIISKEMYKLNGVKPTKSELAPWIKYQYDPPHYLRFKTRVLQEAFQVVLEQEFGLNENGSIELPLAVASLKFTIGETTYQMGIGGIHSTEANRAVLSKDGFILIERDVASYYPFIILNNELYPEQLGYGFLTVYGNIVNRRLEAKAKGKAGDEQAKREEAALKITINGSFGKLGNRYSVLYSPKLLIQVTITGQLSLLYLIEKIELIGIRVVSANTDGLVIRCPVERYNELNGVIAEWERETNFQTEETIFLCIGSRSVNDYMGLKRSIEKDGSIKVSCKGKGKLGRGITKLFKNPDNFICITAIEKYLTEGKRIEETIRECTDITEFVTVRVVKGGGCKDGQFLGKVIRYYYSTKTDSPIVYAGTGNKVPDSEGAMPAMILPESIPDDLDYAQYIRKTKKLLEEMGLIY